MPSQVGQLYRAVWRWHFYAGVFVIPFLLILSLSGLLMLLAKPLEPLLYQGLVSVQPGEEKRPATALLAVVRDQYPGAQVQLYIPPRKASESARFSLLMGGTTEHAGHDEPSQTVYLNPYSGEILGALDPTTTLYARLKTFHGTIFLGDVGDTLLEVAAGLSVLVVLSGLFLAWARGGLKLSLPRRHLLDRREGWRLLHRAIGLVIALPLLFFLISGLAWTNVWGGKLVQPWSSLPGTSFDAPKDHRTHDSMNQEGLHQVPWTMEQTPLPVSVSAEHTYDLDAILQIAKRHGFINFRVHFPRDDSSVWTVSATTIAGDLTTPSAERTLHIDPSNGQVLADLRFTDYPALGKAMAAFIPLHQGDLGFWNFLLNLLLVTSVITLIIAGIALWWIRLPPLGSKLTPPTASPTTSRVVLVVMLVVSICFPLSAAALALAILFDWLLISRVNRWRAAVK